MKIFIIGAGEVGYHIAYSLVREGHDLVMVDQDAERVRDLQSTLDVLAVQGDGCDPGLLKKYGVDEADRFFAVTNDNASNLLAALTARRMGVAHSVVRVAASYYRDNPLIADDSEGIVPIFPEELVARELLSLTRLPGANSVQFFEQDRLVLVYARPSAAATHVYGKPLKDLDWPEGWVLTGVSRLTRVVMPTGNTVLEPEQPIYAMGRTDKLPDLVRYLGIEVQPTRRVVVAGGGQVGAALSRLLTEAKIDVTVIERDPKRAFDLAATVPGATVLKGDATDPVLLREAGVEETDFFVAATEADMTNILSSLLARELGASTTVALYNRLEFEHVMKASRIDLPLSPRIMIAGTILKTVHTREILTLDLVGAGDAEIVDFAVPATAQALNKPLKELRIPGVIGAVVRGEEIYVPDGEFRFQPHDHVLIFTLTGNLPQLEKLFRGR